MIVQCQSCGYGMSTTQEVTQTLVRSFGGFVGPVADLVCKVTKGDFGAGGTAIIAKPLNGLSAKCLRCGSAGCFEDVLELPAIL